MGGGENKDPLPFPHSLRTPVQPTQVYPQEAARRLAMTTAWGREDSWRAGRCLVSCHGFLLEPVWVRSYILLTHHPDVMGKLRQSWPRAKTLV